MTLQQLIARVQDLVQDNSVVTEPNVIGWLNDAMAEATTQVDIMELSASAEIPTVLAQAWTALPSNYQRDMSRIMSKTQAREVKVKESLNLLLDWYPLLDKVGAVVMATVDQGKLWYQGIPEAIEDLVLYYRRKPATLTGYGDVPEGIPAHLHLDVLVYHAASIAWDMVEQGIDGQKVNTIAYMQRYQLGMRKLRQAVTPRIRGFRG